MATIPTAAEMAKKTQAKVDKEIEGIFEKIENDLLSSDGFSTTVSLTSQQEKLIDAIRRKLHSLGYDLEYTPGYYEDRPYGGYVKAKLTIGWAPETAQ